MMMTTYVRTPVRLREWKCDSWDPVITDVLGLCTEQQRFRRDCKFRECKGVVKMWSKAKRIAPRQD